MARDLKGCFQKLLIAVQNYIAAIIPKAKIIFLNVKHRLVKSNLPGLMNPITNDQNIFKIFHNELSYYPFKLLIVFRFNNLN